MKAKSRRRLLISSVAMLLVAMLALGTATFAWFTVDTDTTASGITVHTNKISTLKVSSMQSAWTTELNYANDSATAAAWQQNLMPASTADGEHWFTAQAKNGGTDYQADTTTITAYNQRANKTNAFFNMLNVKNFGNADLTNVKIELQSDIAEKLDSSDASHKYLRAALIPAVQSNGSAIAWDGVVGSETDTRSTAKVDLGSSTFSSFVKSAADDTADALTEASLNDTETITSTAGKLSVTISSLAKNEAKYYMLIVWFEGQDLDCADSYSGNVMPAFTFDISADAN